MNIFLNHMIEKFKPLYEQILKPVLGICRALHIHPNMVTMAGVVVFCVAGWLSARGHWYAAAGCVTGGACLDGLDGLLARSTGKKTVFGAVLDSTCDRITEIVLIAGLVFFYMISGQHVLRAVMICLAAITGSLMVSYVRARCEGANIVCGGGIMQRPERIILLIVGLLAGPVIMLWILGGIALLSYGTTIGRLWRAYKNTTAI